MGTYTTNYNLFMPTIGETGWGELVNGNFTTIDNTMKGLSNRIAAVENEVNGALSCTSVTTSGKITGNGGIAGTTGTFSGDVRGTSFNDVIIKSGTITVTPNNTKIRVVHSKGYTTVLPLQPNVTYTGSLIISTTWASNTSGTLYYYYGAETRGTISGSGAKNVTIPFTNIPYFVIEGETNCFVSAFTFS